MLKVQGTEGHSCFRADKVTLHLALNEDHRKANTTVCVLFLKKEKLQSQLSPKSYLQILPLDLLPFANSLFFQAAIFKPCADTGGGLCT